MINQNIEPGSKVVPKDTMIILTKSIGVKQEYVKDYTGEEISKATSELEALGFKVEQSEVESDEPADTIVKQSFKDGQLPVESTIYFDVSKGEDKDSNSDKSDKSDDKDKKMTVMITQEIKHIHNPFIYHLQVLIVKRSESRDLC